MVLQNGLRVFLLEDHELGLVSETPILLQAPGIDD
jgi:hypothetical protein